MDNSFLHSKKLLLVDDEQELLKMVSDILKDAGFETVLTAMTVKEAILTAKEDTPDLIVLDVMLPDGDGFSLMKQLRTFTNVPIIFLTAKDEAADKLAGLGLGADDYISKPFSLREVIARVKAVLRRTATVETEKAPERLTYQSLVIDITKKKVSIDDEEVQLTKKEFEILLLLVQNKGRVFSREDILARIWSDEVYVLDRTIDVNITRLRKKIGEYGKCIVTRLGYGYCFEAE